MLHLLMIGNPIRGWRFVGTFQNVEEAALYRDQADETNFAHDDEDIVWIVPLEAPADLEGTQP